MTSLQARTLSRATMAATDASRLELLEYFLVHNDDVAACAQASLEWLGRYAGVKRSVCLAVDNDAGVLIGVLQVFTGFFVSSQLKFVPVYLLYLAVVLVWPRGLAGRA